MQFIHQATDKNTKARAGKLITDHGEILTPIFMPVGTVGSVKAVYHHELTNTIRAQIILGNTYHLFLRPGTTVLKQAGGIHKFCNWNKPVLTDSGGYQVFSLSDQRKINEDGVMFRSHIDGSKHLFTPENVINNQRLIGADIIMAFDECTPYPVEKKKAEVSMQLTHRWLERCCKRFDETECGYGYSQTLFPIIQGSTFADLRKQSAEFIANKNRDGNAIGGLSVGEPAEMMYEMTDLVCNILPTDKPRYLMGVGTPANLLECIALGVDMFDCVLPTRNGRNGMLFTTEGIINIKNKKWESDFSVIDPGIQNSISNVYTKSYLRHLTQSGEMLASMISSVHNLSFYLWLMGEARNKILNGEFSTWKNKMVKQLSERL